MRNPFRSEADAFRFVWLTIGYFGLIVVGSVINRWVGVAVFVALTALALWWLFGRGEVEAPVKQAPAAGPPDEHVISTHPVGRSHWLERGVVEKARERFALPVTHVVVDLYADRS